MDFYSIENLSKLQLIEEYWSYIESRPVQEGDILKGGKVTRNPVQENGLEIANENHIDATKSHHKMKSYFSSLDVEQYLNLFTNDIVEDEQRSELERLYPDANTLMKIAEETEKHRSFNKRTSKILTRFLGCE